MVTRKTLRRIRNTVAAGAAAAVASLAYIVSAASSTVGEVVSNVNGGAAATATGLGVLAGLAAYGGTVLNDHAKGYTIRPTEYAGDAVQDVEVLTSEIYRSPKISREARDGLEKLVRALQDDANESDAKIRLRTVRQDVLVLDSFTKKEDDSWFYRDHKQRLYAVLGKDGKYEIMTAEDYMNVPKPETKTEEPVQTRKVEPKEAPPPAEAPKKEPEAAGPIRHKGTSIGRDHVPMPPGIPPPPPPPDSDH